MDCLFACYTVSWRRILPNRIGGKLCPIYTVQASSWLRSKLVLRFENFLSFGICSIPYPYWRKNCTLCLVQHCDHTLSLKFKFCFCFNGNWAGRNFVWLVGEFDKAVWKWAFWKIMVLIIAEWKWAIRKCWEHLVKSIKKMRFQ